MAAFKCFSKLNGNHYEISDTDKYFSNPELSEALKEAEEDIAAGRVREVKDSRQLWEGIQ